MKPKATPIQPRTPIPQHTGRAIALRMKHSLEPLRYCFLLAVMSSLHPVSWRVFQLVETESVIIPAGGTAQGLSGLFVWEEATPIQDPDDPLISYPAYTMAYWSLASASISLTETTATAPRIPTPLIDVTAGGTPYPAFPGVVRPGASGACSCNATTGGQRGTGCNRGAGGAGFGRP